MPPPTVDPQTPPMPAVDLVVTDLDGTFWHTDDHLPDGVLDAVAELERRGIPLLVATGRRLASTRDPLASFGLAPPAIMLNGAIGIDLRTGERFHMAPYPAAQALAAYDAFVAAGLSPVVYVDHPEWDVFLSHQPDTNPAHVKALGDTAGRHYGPDERTMVDDLRAEVARTPVLGFSMIGVPVPGCGDRLRRARRRRGGPPRPLDRLPRPGVAHRRAPGPVQVGRRARLLHPARPRPARASSPSPTARTTSSCSPTRPCGPCRRSPTPARWRWPRR